MSTQRDVKPKQAEQNALQIVADLGILDLDDRYEFSIDPMSHLMAATEPKDPPTNGNCGGCATNVLC